MKPAEETLFDLIRVALGNAEWSSIRRPDDWRSVYELSKQHGVIALACSEAFITHTKELGVDFVLQYEWLGQRIVVEDTNRAKLSAASQLANLWIDSGLRLVVLKGFSYAQYYPEPLHRVCSDLDSFLFERWEDGNQLVEQHGVPVSRSYYKNSSFDFHGLFVENHRFCSPIRGGKQRKSYEAFLQSLLKTENCSKIPGLPFLSPSPLFNCLFFISHAQNHFLNEGGIQLRHVCDWGVLLKAYGTDTELWKQFLEGCSRFGFLKFAYSISQVAGRVCGVRIPFDCPSNDDADSALLKEIVNPTCVQVEFSRGWHTRWLLVKSMWESRWKYKLYSEQNILTTFLQMVIAFVLEKHPTLYDY